MKHILTFIAFCIITGITGTGYARYGFTTGYIPAESEVYICVSSGAKVYHSRENCHGLKACTHTIKKVTLKEAINDYNRRACKVCYK